MAGKKVLIADDDNTVLQAGKLWLEGNGYQVVTVDDGAKALEGIRKEKPDFAVLDVVMPEMNGFEVCRAVKEDRETRDTVVLIVSGNVPEIEKGFDYGADDCIIKPLDWANLAERMEELTSELWQDSDL